ncbi:hypothetical protein QL285_038043 [Trifolium repens]|nr:hypothetical protein QL285_038043 [Trifolium repens]
MLTLIETTKQMCSRSGLLDSLSEAKVTRFGLLSNCSPPSSSSSVGNSSSAPPPSFDGLTIITSSLLQFYLNSVCSCSPRFVSLISHLYPPSSPKVIEDMYYVVLLRKSFSYFKSIQGY